MQARLIKGIQKPRPEFETVGACLIMLHGISDAGANFECWYVEFLGHQEQHLEFIDAAAAHMSAYDDNPRAQARAILRMDGADLRTRNEEELATLSSKCLTTWTRAIIRGMKGGTGFKAGNAERRGCGDNTQDVEVWLLLPRLLVSRKSCPRAPRRKTKSVTQTSMRPNSWRPCSPRALLTLGSPQSTPRSPPLACSAPSHPRSRCVK